MDALAALELRLKNADIKCVFVDVPFAQHTDAMIPVSSELTTIAKTIPISAPSIPIVSGLHGTLVPAGDSSIFDVHYFSRHCTKPVYFEDGINSLLSSGGFGSASAWIEIGPHPTCLPMLKCIPTTSEQSLHLPSLRRSIANEITLSAALASLYCHSITINWCRVFEVLHPQARLVDLPSYPFARNSFWVPYDSVHSLPKTPVILKPPQHSLLTRPETHLPNYSHLPSMFEVDFHKVVPLIEGHKVSGYALCPASVYIELAMAAALESLRGEYRGSSVILDTLSFPNALVHSPGTQKVIRISLPPTERCGGDVGSFEIISHLAKNPDQQQTNCRGSFALQSASVVSTTLSTSEPTLKSCRDSILANQDCETFRTRTIYGSLFCKVVEYAPQYQAIRWIKISQDRTDAYSVCKLPPQEFTGPFVVHPILLDTLLHAAGFVVNVDAGGNEIFICHQLTKVVILPELMAWDSPFGVYCNVSSRSETGCVVEVFATQIHDDVPGAVIAHLQRVDFRRLRLSGFRTLLASSASQTENNTSLGLTPITPTTEGIYMRYSSILHLLTAIQ